MDTLVGLLESVAPYNDVHLWHMMNHLINVFRNVWPPNRSFGSKPASLYALVPLM